jgi:integrase
MRGHIRKKGQHSWQITLDIGTGSDGKRRRHFETVHGRKSDAQKRLAELLVSMEKGVYTAPGRLTLAEYLRAWFDGYVKSNCQLRTQDGYQSIIERHLVPGLGYYQLKYLTPQTIQGYYGKASEKLSSRTVAKHHRLLSQALKYAVRQGYLGRNPCELVDAPSWKPKPMRTLTEWELQIFLEAANQHSPQYYPVYYTAVSTGLRQGELCGLRWRDLDLDLLSLSVNQVLYKRRGVCEVKTPKTQHSRRRVSLTPKLALFLKDYQAERETLYWELAGKPLPLDSFVFGFPGKPCDPSMLSHDFAIIAKKVGFEGVRFHDLRHTFATLMLMRGAPAKVISEALGHASVAFTLQTYAHVLSGMQEKAMALLDEILPAGVTRNYVAKLSPTF